MRSPTSKKPARTGAPAGAPTGAAARASATGAATASERGSQPDWPATTEITDPAAIALLLDLRSLRALSPFLSGPRTLSDAAARLRLAPSTLAYQLGKLVAHGLVVRYDVIARPGRPMPRYRSVAQRLTIPVSAAPLAARIAALDKGRFVVMRAFCDGVDEATADPLITVAATDDEPGFVLDVARSEASPPLVHDSWVVAHLSDQRLAELVAELDELRRRYSDPAGPSRSKRACIIHLGAVRAPTQRWRSADDPRIV